MPSFDVVSRVDMQEVDNAVNQVIKEINTRYDFKGTKSKVELNDDHISLLADDKMKLEAITVMLNQKIVKRGIGIKSLNYKEAEPSSGDMLKQKVEIKQGISTEDGKKLSKQIRDMGLKKINTQIQGDQVRVTGPKRDALQEVIAMLEANGELELQFVNFKD